MTADELRNVTFDHARKGYRTEDVDDYLVQAAQAMEQLEAELAARENEILALQNQPPVIQQPSEDQLLPLQQQAADLQAVVAQLQADNNDLQQQLQAYQGESGDVTAQIEELEAKVQTLEGEKYQLAEATRMALAAKDEAESKMLILAEKAEEYRGQEETLKSTLINAQRLGETVVHEAKQKADQMLREATGQTELLRQRAEQECARERQVLENLVGEVNRFKTTILNLYKQHIESLSAMDSPVNRAEEYLAKDKNDLSPMSEEPVLGHAEPELPAAAKPAEGKPAGDTAAILEGLSGFGSKAVPPAAPAFGGTQLDDSTKPIV